MPCFKNLLVLAFFLMLVAVLDQAQATSTAAPAGGIVFADSGQSLGHGFSSDVALGDLDGDGDQDAIVTNSGATPNEIWWNQGGNQGGTEGIFLFNESTVGGQTQRALALADLDGDADRDVFLVQGVSTDSYQVWINQGGDQGGTAGVFARNAFTANDGLGTNVALGDIDGDGDLDAYIPRTFDSDVLYLNDGTGLFTISGQALETADALGADLGDVDGDGDLDIFVAVNGGPNTVWQNQGGAQGGTEGMFLNTFQSLGNRVSMNIVLADLDGDTDLDAFVANATEDIIWVNQGGDQGGIAGQFADSGQLLGFSASRDVKVADLDGDADLDAFVAAGGANLVWVNQGGLQGGTAGQFVDSGLALGSAFSNAVALADVDGDGDHDAFVANSNPLPNKVYRNDSGAPPPPVNPEGWQAQLVAVKGRTGFFPSLALDAFGRPHIAYVTEFTHPEGIRERLIYRYWDGMRWHEESVADASDIGETIALTVDSNGIPHLAYTAQTELLGAYVAVYTFWNGSGWQRGLVDRDVEVEQHIALGLDRLNRPHLSYAVDEPTQQFRYARSDGSSWQIETIDAIAYGIYSVTSLAVDANDRPHVVYLNQQALQYAHFDGTTWRRNTIDDAVSPVMVAGFDLVLIGDFPAVAYYGGAGGTLKYAQWDGSNWQIEAVTTPAFPSLDGNLDLAIDAAGRPHISYSYYVGQEVTALRLIYRDDGQWIDQTLATSETPGYFSSLSLDDANNPHIAYHDNRYSDMRYLTWAPTWRIRSVPAPQPVRTADVQVQSSVPYFGYHSLANRFVTLAHWDKNWVFSPADSVPAPVSQVSVALSLNFRHLSYYDADTQDLLYGRQTDQSWQIHTVDSVGDVGRYNQILAPGGSDNGIRIAYWDETNRQVKLALYDGLANTFQLHTNLAAPELGSGSGPLSATALPAGDVGIAYYNALGTSLRFARWDAESELWNDELVDGLLGDVGSLNSIQMDTLCGCPVIAYLDESNEQVMFGYRSETGWQLEPVTVDVAGLTSLALELGLGSWQRPRLVFTTGDQVLFVDRPDGQWRVQVVEAGRNNPGPAALALDSRAHIAYPDQVDGLRYTFRTADLDFLPTPTGSPAATAAAYNGLAPCGAVVDLLFGRSAPSGGVPGPGGPVGNGRPSGDDDVFDNMRALFTASTGGQRYVDLYFTHAAEMGQIGLADPQLMWDGYATLQNFMPGLEALVTGQGDQLIVTQQMADDALDVWQRIAAVAGPDLAAVIHSELAQSNNLQDFVGLTFDGWALALGVTPPANRLYLPAFFGDPG